MSSSARRRVTAATDRMGVGGIAVAAIPAPASAINPDSVAKPGPAAVDDSDLAVSGADAASPAELQADKYEKAEENLGV